MTLRLTKGLDTGHFDSPNSMPRFTDTTFLSSMLLTGFAPLIGLGMRVLGISSLQSFGARILVYLERLRGPRSFRATAAGNAARLPKNACRSKEENAEQLLRSLHRSRRGNGAAVCDSI